MIPAFESHWKESADNRNVKALDTYLVGGQIFEQRDCSVEKIDKFVLSLVVGVAAWIECGIAGAMLAPFVFPDK